MTICPEYLESGSNKRMVVRPLVVIAHRKLALLSLPVVTTRCFVLAYSGTVHLVNYGQKASRDAIKP